MITYILFFDNSFCFSLSNISLITLCNFQCTAPSIPRKQNSLKTTYWFAVSDIKLNDRLILYIFCDLDLETVFRKSKTLGLFPLRKFRTSLLKSLRIYFAPITFFACAFLARKNPLPRKEVIQPHLPVRLPCYDFTPVTNPALGRCFQMVSSRTSGVVDFHGVTGGVYKTRERIQRSVLICVY